MLERFSQPDSEFRGMPFWAWNSKLQPEELRRQIGIFRQMGFGGFFMHARVGLSTEYLGKEWFDCIRICCEEARKFGMQAWLYDEDRWPSGAAGGMVTRNDQYKMKDLRYECVQTLRDALTSENTLAFFIVSGDLAERTLKCYRRIEPAHDVNLQDGESLLRFYWKNEARTSWFNGETYLDTMNAEAVSSFIAATHEAYKANIGELFGQSVPGIFTDEPCFSYADGTCARRGHSSAGGRI